MARGPIEAVFVETPGQWERHDWGAPKIEWVRQAVRDLQSRLPVIVLAADRFADQADAVLAHAQTTGCDAIVANAEYEVNELARDRSILQSAADRKLGCRFFPDQTLFPIESLRSPTGKPYMVYTPFNKNVVNRIQQHGIPAPLDDPARGETSRS